MLKQQACIWSVHVFGLYKSFTYFLTYLQILSLPLPPWWVNLDPLAFWSATLTIWLLPPPWWQRHICVNNLRELRQSEAGMLRPRGQHVLKAKFFDLGLGLVVSGLGLVLGLMQHWPCSRLGWPRGKSSKSQPRIFLALALASASHCWPH